MATIKDVARMAGVSISTVSYVINGTRPISEDTKQLIYDTMEKLGYKPHAMARALASRRSRIIGLVFDPPERGLGITEMDLVSHAASAAKEFGYHLVIVTSDVNEPEKLNELTGQGLLDGVILLEILEHDKRVKYLSEKKIPFSMVGRCADIPDALYVDIDFDESARLAVEHLQSLGHKNILFINQSQEIFASGYGPAVQGQEFFLKWCEHYNVKGEAVFCHTNRDAGFSVFNEKLTACPDVTAAVVMNDRALPGIIQAAKILNLDIPKDLSLLAFVSSPRLADMFVPALTTLDIPARELGRTSVVSLLEKLENTKPENAQSLIPCVLDVRESTGKAREK